MCNDVNTPVVVMRTDALHTTALSKDVAKCQFLWKGNHVRLLLNQLEVSLIDVKN